MLLSSIKACAVSGDIDGVERYMEKFREHSEHMQEVRFRFGLLEGLIESADDEQNG